MRPRSRAFLGVPQRGLAANSSRHEEFGQHIEVVRSRTAKGVARRIEGSTHAAVQDTSVAALTLLFPAVTELTTLIDVALLLGKEHGWRVTRTSLPNARCGPVVAFGMAREIPFGGTAVPSEALVLGGFDVFPAT